MLRNTAVSVDEAQKMCDRGGPYYLKKVSIEQAQKMGLKQFLKQYLYKWNKEDHTYNVKSDKVQCEKNRLRSITDMTRLAKHYFPNSNVVTVRNALLELSHEKEVSRSICSTVERGVFGIGTGSNRDERDEFGWAFNKPQRRMPNVQNIKPEEYEQDNDD